ncbi:MAG: hypothetical protein HJJLKODD_02843 [Phycisphaerae bacterium]|nr:hypothetical protein [Phycisphaerae bacterium]
MNRNGLRGNFRLLFCCSIWMSAIVWPVVAQEAVPTTSPVAEATASEPLWAAGFDRYIAAGEFDQARDSLIRIVESNPQRDSYRDLVAWMDQLKNFNQQRAELQTQQCDQLILRAKHAQSQSQWSDALGYVIDAMHSTTDTKEFLREPWVQEIHDQVDAQATRSLESGDWRVATDLYDRLCLFDPKSTYYKDRLDESIAHARLDALYSAEFNWRDRLRGITQKMGEDVLWRIHSGYVSEADFRTMTTAALKKLLYIAQSPSMSLQFSNLAEADKKEQFVSRISRRLERIKDEADFSYTTSRDVLRNVLKINSQTVDLPPELIIYEYIEGALGSLDQFTSMIWPADFSEFEKQTQGHFIGVGIQIILDQGRLTVSSPLEDTPAFRAGIQSEDLITHIDGESTENITLIGAVNKITGAVGTDVTLTVHRPSTEQTFDVKLTRQEIQIVSVKGWQRVNHSETWDYMIDPTYKIGYVRITNFADNTVSELKRVLNQLQSNGVRAVVFDLRFNPGGLLRSAIEMSELFLPRDKTIVSTRGLRSEEFVKNSEVNGLFRDLPMVVLINDQSASASEIVSGALKDHGRAIIVGERSFGKGSVQNLIPMGSSNAHLKLTTAYYYLPSGRCLHKTPESEIWGVEPDIAVTLVPREAIKVWSLWRKADVIGTVPKDALTEAQQTTTTAPATSAPASQPVAGTQTQPTELDLPEIAYPEVDYQLETALLILRVQLLKQYGLEQMDKVRLGENSNTTTPAVVTN